jgi:hypothetical protein
LKSISQIGSPSALADKDLEKSLISASEKFGVFIPSGALWGGSDIRKMSDRNALKVLSTKSNVQNMSV